MHTNLFIGKKIIELKSIDSTNNYLSKYINETNVLNGSVILAHNQTKGRDKEGMNGKVKMGKILLLVFTSKQIFFLSKTIFY